MYPIFLLLVKKCFFLLEFFPYSLLSTLAFPSPAKNVTESRNEGERRKEESSRLRALSAFTTFVLTPLPSLSP